MECIDPCQPSALAKKGLTNLRSFPRGMECIDPLGLGVAVPPDLQEWTNRAETYDNLTNSVRIAMVGKYVGFQDSYLSVIKAFLHACTACSLKPAIDWIVASNLEDESAKSTPDAYASAWQTLKNAACVLVPGGFGDRGVTGMILAAKYAMENNVPYLGICLGILCEYELRL